MANNERGQSLITKYVWVTETIYRKRKISFKELNEPGHHEQFCHNLWQYCFFRICHNLWQIYNLFVIKQIETFHIA